MEPLLRPEYFDAAVGTAAAPEQVAELEALRRTALQLGEDDAAVQRQCVENRIQAGEKARRTKAPSSVRSASERAADDLHEMAMDACRCARSPSQIVEVMLRFSRDETTFNRSLLQYIDLPANRKLNEDLLDAKEALQRRFEQFMARWPHGA